MRNKMYSIVALLLFFFSLNSFAQDISKHSITVEQFHKLMKNDSTLVILDVRTPQELKGRFGHIPGVINIPVQVLTERLKELNKYKNRTIAVICRSGHRSAIASRILLAHGFKIKNVLGGMIAYTKKYGIQKK